jgi:hypothetical protein
VVEEEYLNIHGGTRGASEQTQRYRRSVGTELYLKRLNRQRHTVGEASELTKTYKRGEQERKE